MQAGSRLRSPRARRAIAVPFSRPGARFLLAALLATACAPSAPVRLASPGGRLRVVNEAGEPVEVFARGSRIVRRLDGGMEARIDRLPLGDCPVEARGERTGWRMGSVVRLDEASETTWTIRGSEAHADALKALPTGGVRFANRSSEPVRVFLDGESRELVWPGGEADLTGIVPGTHRLSAEGTKTLFRSAIDVRVSPGSLSRFDIEPPRASLRVTNRSGVAAWVIVRGGRTQRLEPAASMTVENRDDGPLDVSARDEQGRLLWEGRATLVRGTVVDVTIPMPDGTLSVLSDLDRPVNVWVDGTNLGLCASTGAAEFHGLPIGRAHVEAVDPEGRVVARADLVLQHGSPTLWMVREGMATGGSADQGGLAIENGLVEPVRVQVDGTERGTIAPGGRRVVPGLSPGFHSVVAFSLLTKSLVRAEIGVSGGSLSSWTALPHSSLLSLRNGRAEEVRIAVDGETRARLAPSETIDLPVPAGAAVVESIGVSTLRQTVHRLVLPADEVTRLVLPPPFASLVATNRRGVPLMLLDGDRQLGVLLPNDRVVLRDLEPGSHRLEARALDRPLSWHQKVTLAAGDEFLWDLGD